MYFLHYFAIFDQVISKIFPQLVKSARVLGTYQIFWDDLDLIEPFSF